MSIVEVEIAAMRYLEVARLPMLALLVGGALLYLAASVVNLFTAAANAANTAPSGTYHAVQIGDVNENNQVDFSYNWDFDNKPTPVSSGSNKVDWGMRFLFAGNAVDVQYVKDRLDGANNDPAITPDISDDGWDKHAFMGDGPQQETSSNWDSDDGIKNWPGCNWNFGHMRIYAREGKHNFHPMLGKYVVASTHVDQEIKSLFGCTKRYRSLESDESAWITRISNHLSSQPYNWSIGKKFNWRNAAGTSTETPNISNNNKPHAYHSDGYGTVINVRENFPPEFDPDDYDFVVLEDASVGAAVGTVSAADENEGDTVSYAITAGNTHGKFAINSSTGKITVTAALTPGVTGRLHTLTVQASDQHGLTDTVEAEVKIRTLAELMNRYDANRNGLIERNEAIAAVVDYFNGLITKNEAIKIIILYFSN